MIIVWGRASSSNVQKVLWLLEELSLDYERIDVGGEFGGIDTEEFAALNPNRRIPVIRDKDLTLWESHTILRYLASAYGDPKLYGENPAERAMRDCWLDWARSRFDSNFMAFFWAYWRTPADQRDAKRIEQISGAVMRDAQLLDEKLRGSRFLAGDNFTLADVPNGAMLYRYYNVGFQWPDLPALRDWYVRLCERPAYRSVVMRTFDELKGRQIH